MALRACLSTAFAAGLGLVGLASIYHTQAATISQEMQVRLEIVASCNVETAAVELPFGTHTNFGLPTTAPINGDAVLQLTCNDQQPWSAYADFGQNAMSGTQRRVRNDATGDYVPYDLYADEARTDPFGTTEEDAEAGTGTGEIQELRLYGRIPAGTQLGGAGQYRDTVVVTFVF